MKICRQGMIFALLGFNLSAIYANAPPLHPLPLFSSAPGISVMGIFGNPNTVVGDALVPVIGQPTGFLYLDPQGLYSGNQYSLSLGTGFRILDPRVGILGAYVFGDYNQSQQNNRFWFVSPGIERLGDTLDFSANLYIPSGRHKFYTNTFFASEVGNPTFLTLVGHDEFDEFFTKFQSTGIGFDGEIGYRLPYLTNNTKLYLGGYYFSSEDATSFGGGIARLEIPIHPMLSLSVSEAYDTAFHNTVRGGLSIALWGRSTHFDNSSVALRMLDPIQRNLVAVDGPSPTSQFIGEGIKDLGLRPILSDIWFFAPGGVFLTTPLIGDCTVEAPCSSNDVNTTFFAEINNIAKGAKMYLAPGDYTNLNSSLLPPVPKMQSLSPNLAELTLESGQSVWGRAVGYLSPASQSDRALLLGSVNLVGNNILDSLQLNNNPTSVQTQGVLVENYSLNSSLNNVLIGNNSNSDNAYPTGIQIGTYSELTVTHSTINAQSSTANVAAIQISGSNNVIDIESSPMDANASAGTAYGIFDNGNNHNQFTVKGGSIVATATSNQNAAPIAAVNTQADQWVVTNNTISATGTTGNVYGILDEGGNGNSWNVSNNNIPVALTNGSSTSAWGIQNDSSSSGWSVAHNSINVSASGTNTLAYGIQTNGSSTGWGISGNTIQVSGSSNSQATFGMVATGGNNIYSLSQNQIVVDGYSTSAGITISDGFNTLSSQGDTIQVTDNAQSTPTYGIVDNGNNNHFTLSGDTISTIPTANQNTAPIAALNTQGDVWVVTNSTLSTTDTTGNVYGILDEAGSSNSWNVSHNNIQVDLTNGSSTSVLGIQNDSSTGNTWSVNNNLITVSATGTNTVGYGIGANGSSTWTIGGNTLQVSGSSDTQATFGVATAGSNNVTLSQNQISVTGPTSKGIAISGGSNTLTSSGDIIQVTNGLSNIGIDGNGSNNTTYNITEDTLVVSADTSAIGIQINTGNGLTVTDSTLNTQSGTATGIQVNGSNNTIDIETSQITATSSVGTTYGIFDNGNNNNNFTVNGGSISTISATNQNTVPIAAVNTLDDIWVVNNVDIGATNTLGNVYGILDQGGNNDSWTVSNNTINIDLTNGPNLAIAGIFNNSALNSNIWSVTDNTIIVSTTGTSTSGYGIHTIGDNTTWTISGNTMQITNSSNADHIFAMQMSGDNNVYNFSQNQMTLTGYGILGIQLFDFNNTMTSSGDTINITDLRNNTETHGVDGNNLGDNVFTFTNDVINIAAPNGSLSVSVGLFDNFNGTHVNTWNVDASTFAHITPTANFEACKTVIPPDFTCDN